MPLYMDIHELGPGVTPEDVAKAHAHDLEVQGKYGVNYSKYWVNQKAGKVFCLCHAPNADAAVQVHREAHGLIAEKLIQVEPDVADLFLGSSEVNSAGAVVLSDAAADERDPGIRTILFTDIVDSTGLTQRLGDDDAMALLDIHNDVVRKALSNSGGREVKHTGDGIMASFVSAAAAVRCAAQIQRDLARLMEDQGERTFKVRIGAAAGEPVEQHDDLFGCTVQLAARLCSSASAEQIVVSNAIAELCLGKGISFQDMGELPLKGFDRPVRAHSVIWAG